MLSAFLGQGSAQGGQAVANNSCVPTSTANGLSFLEQYAIQILGIPDPFTVTPNNVAAINALQTAQQVTANGTSAANSFSGLNSYLSPTGANPAPSVTTAQNFDPTAALLGNQLSANNAVQLGVLWGNIAGGAFTAANGGGGHFVSLTAMNLNAGAGTMTILDPWGNSGGANASTEGAFISLNVSTVNLTGVGNVLQVTWTTNAPEDTFNQDGTDPSDFGAAGATGYIAVENVEAVPEPGAVAMLGVGAAGLLLRLRRGRKAI
ncbi:MAG: PEP-CTERM sorting domain-containing protein [Verrucomicrobiota bacterium]|nr:PEP-CTERM sorting domain-containing protein [Verrucomicrobiota bacterium]